MIGYHVCLSESLSGILAEGLRPRIGSRSQQLDELTPGIFLFPDRDACEDALLNWLGEALEEEGEICILEIDLTGIPPECVRSAVGYELQVSCTLGPERIVRVLDEQFGLRDVIDDPGHDQIRRRGLGP